MNKVSKSTSDINILGEWLSIFTEDERLMYESVSFNSFNGKNIKGTFITLLDKEIENYQFYGTFENKILNGIYHNDEKQGIISLIYVSSQQLFGYCTLIDRERNIYNTPYVLIKTRDNLTINEKKEQVKNIYDFCKNNRVCGICCNGIEIDLPILLPFEREQIAQEYKIEIDDFCKLYKEDNNVIYQMKTKSKNGGCYFYKENKCSIYDYRPLDCRLFPFVHKINDNNEFELVLFKQACKNGALPNFDNKKIEYYYYLLQPIIHITKPYMLARFEKSLNLKLSNIEPMKFGTDTMKYTTKK